MKFASPRAAVSSERDMSLPSPSPTSPASSSRRARKQILTRERRPLPVRSVPDLPAVTVAASEALLLRSIDQFAAILDKNMMGSARNIHTSGGQSTDTAQGADPASTNRSATARSALSATKSPPAEGSHPPRPCVFAHCFLLSCAHSTVQRGYVE